jgi:hypothetical protein
MPSHIQPYFGKQALLTHESSHDTFDERKHKNWLVNEAGIGTYAHGRIHQQFGNTIYVGDLIHKRGHLKSDDLLLMEEQALLSMGEPLSVPSRLGSLRAMEVLPTMNTANGEGALIAYYDHGVVAFDTHEAPRETRHDGEGNVTQKGWDTKRLVNHLLNTVGAVGRYAVAVLTRDHLFRSSRGLHFLKVILGEGTFNSENTNTVSQDISPLLDADTDLDGAAVGFWPHGNRMFATTGLVTSESISTTSFGRGFVSWNQATSYTEDRTPVPAWEGLWRPDDGIRGIHRFVSEDRKAFGFVCSDDSCNILKATIDPKLEKDVRDGSDIPIGWSFTTGQFALSGLNTKSTINDAVLEVVVSDSSQRIQVWSRTDADGQWRLWHEFRPSERQVSAGQRLLLTESLGRPHSAHREATWIQARVSGVGYVEPKLFEVEHSPSTAKAGRGQVYVVNSPQDDPFESLTPKT